MKKNLIYTLGLAVPLALTLGCNDPNTQFLKHPKGSKEITIQERDTYWSYAKKLRKECNQLRKLDIREVVDYLTEKNNRKNLIKGETAILPEYNCKNK